MSWRKCVSVLAVLGVLLHAIAVVRHHAVMLAAPTIAGDSGPISDDLLRLTKDLSFICHVSADGIAAAAPADDSGTRDGRQTCPICAGLASPFAVAAKDMPALAIPAPLRITVSGHADERLTVQRRIRPPSRGPPLPA